MKGQLRVNFPHYQLIRAYLKKTEQKMVFYSSKYVFLQAPSPINIGQQKAKTFIILL